tara:strand:+ start:14838 stop:16121 length:1284 start_codon:yes stop_codon:yes gene_type:complete
MAKIKIPLENRNGILHIGNCNTIDLAKEYDTPLYVYDENRIRDNFRRLHKAFSSNYKKFRLYYAIKANNNPALLKILKSEGSGVDVSGPAEIYLAKKAGFSTENMLYSGVYHRDDELKYALENNVPINLEDVSQIERLFKFGKPKFLSFRINPGIGKGSFKGNVYAGKDAKFGIIERDAIKAYEKAKNLGVESFGIHMMTGSCVLDENYFVEITGKLMDIAGAIAKKLNIKFEFVDIGGGFGVPYAPDEKELDIDLIGKNVCEKFKEKIKEYDLGEPILLAEPGRYLVCDSAILLTKVHSIKNGYKKFIGVDAGMNTLIRPMIYGAYHEILVANNLDAEPEEKVNIVGPVCENTDQFAKDRLMPKIAENDLLAILNVGAYGFGMSSQYNNRPRAAEVLINDGKHELIRQRENFDDLIKGVKIPERLK